MENNSNRLLSTPTLRLTKYDIAEQWFSKIEKWSAMQAVVTGLVSWLTPAETFHLWFPTLTIVHGLIYTCAHIAKRYNITKAQYT